MIVSEKRCDSLFFLYNEYITFQDENKKTHNSCRLLNEIDNIDTVQVGRKANTNMKIPIQLSWVFFLLSCSVIVVSRGHAYSPISLTTTSSLSKTSAQTLYQFLGSPANWPKIVASSHSVVSPQGKDLGIPLKVSESVDEIFGLPPLLPLSVSWKCVKSIPPTNTKPGYLDFYSQDGLGGVATDCRMQFVIEDPSSTGGDASCCNVKLDMSYEPVSPIAVLAIPALVIDNAVALQLLLPSVLSSQSSSPSSPLDKFRELMGSLYGVAGVAHLADCLVDSQLLVTAGSQPFGLLPPLGKAYALLWCAAGPVSFGTSRIGGKVADLGLILYGLVEVVGAYLIRFQTDASAVTESSSTTMMDPFVNAILVQGVVAAAWLYSSLRQEE